MKVDPPLKTATYCKHIDLQKNCKEFYFVEKYSCPQYTQRGHCVLKLTRRSAHAFGCIWVARICFIKSWIYSSNWFILIYLRNS
jgi:hypothetical protein